MLASLSEVARNTIDSTTLQQVWQVAERYILPECQHLPDADGSIGKSIGTLLLTLELVVHSLAPKMDSEFDPFRISTTLTGSGVPVRHQDVLVEMLRSESGKVGMYEAAKDVVRSPISRSAVLTAGHAGPSGASDKNDKILPAVKGVHRTGPRHDIRLLRCKYLP
jgi:hypothetical protein